MLVPRKKQRTLGGQGSTVDMDTQTHRESNVHMHLLRGVRMHRSAEREGERERDRERERQRETERG